MEIAGRVAVVTGAGSGIGHATAIELARRKVQAIAVVDQVDAVNRTAASINEFTGGHVHACAFVGNVADEEFRHRVFDHMTQEHEVPRMCIPAAGITRDSLAAKVNRETGKAELYPIADFRLLLEINLLAPVYWALEMVGRIAEDRHRRGLGQWATEEHIQGAVVFVGSVSTQGNKGQIAYAATKSGLQGASATLTKEAMYHGVRCSVLHPGFTDTPMVRALGEEFIRTRILPSTQLRRLIRPDEIADAVCFMIANSAVNGQLWADAGWIPSI